MSPHTSFTPFCLHSALLAYNALIFNGVQRADSSQKRVHYHLHLSALHATEGRRSGAEFLLWEGGFSVGRTSLPLALYCFFSVAQPVCAAADTSRLKVQTNVMRADNGAYFLHHCLHALLIDNYCSQITPITRIFFARATCFSTTEMTDLTDFVSIACSLRY